MGIYKPNGDYLMDKPAWLDLPATEGRLDRLVTINWIPSFPIPARWLGDGDNVPHVAQIETIAFEKGQYRNGAPKWRLVDEESLRRFEALVDKNRHWFW